MIDKLPTLKPKEISFNIEKARQGDVEARNKIIYHYSNLVINKINEEYFDSNYSKEDLFQAGIIGILKALKNLNGSTNPQIVAKIHTYINSEIEYLIGIEKKENKYKYDIINQEFELDTSDYFSNIEYMASIENIIKDLPQKQQKILYLYFFENYSQTEIAKMYNVTRSAVYFSIKTSIEYIKKEVTKKRKRFDYTKNQLIKSNDIASDIDKFKKENLNNTDFDNISDDNKEPYDEQKTIIIPKSIEIIEDLINKRDGIYQLFPNHTIDEIDNAIFLISKNEISLLKFVYSKETLDDNLKDNNFNLIVNKIHNILTNKLSICEYRQNTIYENFCDYSEEEIDISLLLINSDDKLKLELYYSKLSLIDNMYIEIKEIINKMKIILKNFSLIHKENYNIYNYFGKYSRSELNNVLFSLSQYEKEAITYRYGNDLNCPITNEKFDINFCLKLYSIFENIKEQLEKNRQNTKILK